MNTYVGIALFLMRLTSTLAVVSDNPLFSALSGSHSGKGRKSCTLILGGRLLEPENPCATLITTEVRRAVATAEMFARSCSRLLTRSKAFRITATGHLRKTSFGKSSPSGEVLR